VPLEVKDRQVVSASYKERAMEHQKTLVQCNSLITVIKSLSRFGIIYDIVSK
jgi:hypothetical protein